MPFRKLDEKIRARLKEALSKEALKPIADEMADMVKKRTRLGYGCDDQGTKEKLKPLSENYKKQRAKKSLSPETTKGKSNLTLTGEMLDSIRGASEDYKLIGEFGDDFSNQKAIWNTNKERPFFKLTQQEVKRISKKIKEHIRKLIG